MTNVLELGAGAAIPFVGRTFVLRGEPVIKVELGPYGDWSRSRDPIVDVGGVRAGAMFHFLNPGKRSVLVDPDDPKALADRLQALWDWADVVLVDEHFLALAAVRERLDDSGPAVVTTVTPFGLAGPDAGTPATPATVFARCGEGGITPGGLGHQLFPDAPPLVARGALVDYDAGVVASLVTLATLLRHERDAEAGGNAGEPARVDVSTFEVAVSNNRWIPGNFTRSGWVETRKSRPYPYGGLMECKDGYAMFLPSTDRHWASLVELMGNPEWAQSSDFATYADRANNAHRLRPPVIAWAKTKTMAELLELGLQHGIPIGPYRSPHEVAACPQLRERGFYVHYGATGEHLVPGLPAPGSVTPERLPLAPALERSELS